MTAPHNPNQYAEWRDETVAAAETHDKYYRALCNLRGLVPGGPGVPRSPDELRAIAKSIDSRFRPDPHLAESVFDAAMRESLRWFDAGKGSVRAIFALNYEKHLRKSLKRAGHGDASLNADDGLAERLAVKRWAERQRVRGDNYRRWARRLVALAVARLGPVAAECCRVVEERGRLYDAEGIGKRFGVSRAAVWRTFEGVRKEIVAMWGELDDEQRGMLVSHLKDEAELTAAQIEEFFGCSTEIWKGKVVSEGELLLRLGWWRSVYDGQGHFNTPRWCSSASLN